VPQFVYFIPRVSRFRCSALPCRKLLVQLVGFSLHHTSWFSPKFYDPVVIRTQTRVSRLTVHSRLSGTP